MIAAIMQPYFFPYIGYFQLMKAVDVFMFLDDVQYIDRGWVNRNRIRVNEAPAWLSFPVNKASQKLPINERHYLLGAEVARAEQRLRSSYVKAAAYSEAAPVIYGLLEFPDANVAKFNANLLTELAGKLGIDCEFVSSSTVGNPQGLRAEDRIIDLCLRIGATQYVNPIGGISLYQPQSFAESGLRLSFQRTVTEPTHLTGGPAHLSMIDILMHSGFKGSRAQMTQYELIDSAIVSTHG